MIHRATRLVLVAAVLTGCSAPGPGVPTETPVAPVVTIQPTLEPTDAEPTSSPVPQVEGRLILPAANFNEAVADGYVEPNADGVIAPRNRTELVEGKWGQKATVYLIHSDGDGPAQGDALVTGKYGAPTLETGDAATLPAGADGTVGRVTIAPKDGLPEWFWQAVSEPGNVYLVTCQPQDGRASSTSNVIVEIIPNKEPS